MRKILIINTTFFGGGAAAVARGLFVRFEKGHDLKMYFAYGRGQKYRGENIFYFGNIFESFIHLLLVRLFSLDGFGNYFTTRRLIKYIERNNFDLINLHNLHGYYLNYKVLFKFFKKHNISVIWTLHDEWPLTWLPAHSLDCKHCKTGLGNCDNQYRYPFSYTKIFAKHLIQRKKNIFNSIRKIKLVAPSKWLFESIGESILKDLPVEVINNCVDVDLFRSTGDKSFLREKYNLPADKKIILYSATNLADRNKGFGYFLELSDRFISNENILFLVAGKGGVFTKFKKNNLSFLGMVNDRSVLSEIISLSDMAIFTSFVETMPLTLLEYMSSGLPVLAWNNKANRELLSSNNMCEDLDDFYEKIRKNIFDEEFLSVVSANLRNRVESDFTEDIFYKKYLSSYLNEI